MFIATSNKAKQLLFLSYVQHVTAQELQRGLEDIKMLSANLPPDFRVLADFSRLDSMELACRPEIGRAMELLEQNGMAMVVRVIPDPSKDIGMSILSLFHYHRKPHIITCDNMADAAKKLAL